MQDHREKIRRERERIRREREIKNGKNRTQKGLNDVLRNPNQLRQSRLKNRSRWDLVSASDMVDLQRIGHIHGMKVILCSSTGRLYNHSAGQTAMMNDRHAEKGEIPRSPVAKARRLGSDFFSSWKQSMQFPKPDNAARARQISQELCSPCSAGHSQDVLLLRNVLQQERQQAKTATPPPLVPPPPTASLKYVPSPNKIAQQISQELCKTRSDADCTDLSFTIDNTPPFGTPAKSSVHRFKQIALEPRSPYWAEGELTAPWVSFHASQEMLIKDAVTKKRLMSLIIVPEPPSQEKSSPENFQAILVNKPTTTTRRRNEKTRQSRSVVRSAYEETPYRAPSTGLLSVRVAVTE